MSIHVLAESPASNDAAQPAPRLEGYVDELGPLVIHGWLVDHADLERTLEVDILADGAPQATTRADVLRSDLAANGLGNGRYGYRIMVPEALLDGLSHHLEVREHTSGYVLKSATNILVAHPATRGEISLDGATLRGEARLERPDLKVDRVLLLEGGKIVAQGVGRYRSGAPGVVDYEIVAPAELFDGRPHGFIVRSADQLITLGAAAIVMPFQLTPDAALESYAREGLTPALSRRAGYRYEALARAIEELSAAPVGEMTSEALHAHHAELAQLARIHRRLIRGLDEKESHYEPLHFPEHASPKVSIVIPLHNKFFVTYNCLASLLLARNTATFEVILVDDGSSDRTLELPKLVSGVTVVRNEEAQGFIKSSNLGAKQARGEYVVMLNNDTEVTNGWLDELLWPFDHFERVGMTGAKLIYPDGKLQEAGGVVWGSGNPWNYGRDGNARDPRYCYARQVDYLSGACILLPRALWDEIGGFSEEYLPAYFEDTDLAFQVRSRGYKTVYAPLAEVVHFEGQSNGTDVASGMKRFQEINRPKFKARWIAACRGNGKDGVDLHLHKDRNISQRALIIDAETPMPDQNAGSYAAISEMRMLQALGFKCTFVPLNVAWLGDYTRQLQRMGVECVYAPFVLTPADIIRQRGTEFDLIYIIRYYVAEPLIELIRKYAPQAKIVLNDCDLHFLRELRAALHARDTKALDAAVKTRDAELAVMRKVDLVLAYTDVEKAVIESHNLSSTKVAKAPWITEVAERVPSFSARIDVAFLGGYRHLPNVEAVRWFVARVMPLLRERLPGVLFRVYGAEVPKSLIDLAEQHPDVIVEGWVKNTSDVYDRCKVFVAPLQSGAGIKGKVIAALASGVPCVLSPLAAEGIAVSDGIEALVATDPAEWVAAIASLYEDEERWSGMSRAAQRFAEGSFGLQKGVRTLQQALEIAELFCHKDSAALAAR